MQGPAYQYKSMQLNCVLWNMHTEPPTYLHEIATPDNSVPLVRGQTDRVQRRRTQPKLCHHAICQVVQLLVLILSSNLLHTHLAASASQTRHDEWGYR